jgi:hypothetical protein
VQNNGQPGAEPGPEHIEPAGDHSRYAFTPPPDQTPNIQFKRVRRESEPGTSPSSEQSRGRLRIRRWHVLTGVVLVAALLLGIGSVGVQAGQAKDHLQYAAQLFAELQAQIGRRDISAAKGTLAALRVETRAAHDATSGLGWTVGGHLPGIGDDLNAVREVSAVLDDVTQNGLPALLDVASGLDPAALAPHAGTVDLTSLNTAGPRIAAGLEVIRRVQAKVAKIDTDGLVDQLAAAVGQLSAGLAKAERLTATAQRAALLLPGMLGADGPRNYLVLFQNNAEVRATGGMPGAYIVVHADAGAITITDQGTASEDLKVFDKPVRSIGEDMESLYTDLPTIFPADVNLTPDFPTAAMLARAMYEKRFGLAVDGVFATDPIALSYLLRISGAVKVPEGEPLNSANAVRVLLSEAYAKYPNPVDQDAYFATAARATFDALIKGEADPAGILTELAKAAGERRVLMWSADPREQAALAGTVLEGRLPDDDGTAPLVGVFLNDGSGAKLSYYLTTGAALTVGDCVDDGSRELQLKLTLGSTAPATGLPPYVTGLALSGEKYTSRTNVMVFSPTGGGVVGITRDGKEVQFGTGIERGRGVGVLTVELPPGSSRTYDVTLQTGVLPQGQGAVRPRLWTTPGTRPWKASVAAGPRCDQ